MDLLERKIAWRGDLHGKPHEWCLWFYSDKCVPRFLVLRDGDVIADLVILADGLDHEWPSKLVPWPEDVHRQFEEVVEVVREMRKAVHLTGGVK